MVSKMRERLVTAVISATLIAVVLGIAEMAVEVSLVRLIGGVTYDELASLTAELSTIQKERRRQEKELVVINDQVRRIYVQNNAAEEELIVIRKEFERFRMQQDRIDNSMSAVAVEVAGLGTRQDASDIGHTKVAEELKGVRILLDDMRRVPLSIMPVDDGNPIRKWFGNEGRWGNWSPVVQCPRERYVCGLRQRVEAPQSDGDDTAMNAVEFYCCLFPQLATRQ